MSSRIESSTGKFAENKGMLLSILANVRLIKGAFGAGASLSLPLVPYQLRDGSASFSIPQGWQVQDLGKTQFISVDPNGRFSFMVAKAEMITPQMDLARRGSSSCPT
ncbi:hypothetical protein IMZ48_03205 [Candidatus Bathyarchaeota archaeon]|nr:hypothetical protein [Candidatus Bathyarchaeota archaeon]